MPGPICSEAPVDGFAQMPGPDGAEIQGDGWEEIYGDGWEEIHAAALAAEGAGCGEIPAHAFGDKCAPIWGILTAIWGDARLFAIALLARAPACAASMLAFRLLTVD